MPDLTYDAFISYSHSADGAFAPALQRGLQHLGRSWRQRRALEVFRDQTGLAVDPDLWAAIATALDRSEWFLLLASPRSAESHWVGQEIEHCLATKGADRILLVVTDGHLDWDDDAGDFAAQSDAVHPLLRGSLSARPPIVDLSWARTETDLTLDHPRFRTAVAQIVAVLRRQPLRAVVEADEREQRRTRRVVRTSIGVLAAAAATTVVAAAGAATAWHGAAQERTVAEDEARAASARELAAIARTTEDPLTALAAAVEAHALLPGAESAGALVAAVNGTGLPLVTVPDLVPAGFSPADIRSSSRTRLALEAADGSTVVEVATGAEWALPAGTHHLAPDGDHAVSADGVVRALGPDGTTHQTAALPALVTPPGFTADGTTIAYLAAGDGSGSTTAQLVVADLAGSAVRSTPVSMGTGCPGCFGDASTVAIAPDGSHVAARLSPEWSEEGVRAEVRTYAVTADGIDELAAVEAGGVDSIRFTDDSRQVWVRDEDRLLRLSPTTLAPAAQPMTVARPGPLLFHDDTKALAPADGCTHPGLLVTPTMATVADLPAVLEATEVGCFDLQTSGGPLWVLDGTWALTSAGAWPTDPDHLVELACAALDGVRTEADFVELTDVAHAPTGCPHHGEDS